MNSEQRATKKQQELLQYVREFIREHDYGPSYREIMRALDYKSVSTVAVHIDGLIAKGYLARRDKSARSLEVVGSASPSPPTQKVSDDVSLVISAIDARLEQSDLSEEDTSALLRVKELFS